MDPNYALLRISMMILLIACLGCGAGVEKAVVTADSVAVEQFTDQGTSWRKQGAPQPTDQTILTRFFQTQSAWRDSTEVEGEPVVYTADDQRRFYWIRSAKENAIWTCIHWERKRFTTSSGVGPLAPTAN